MAQWGKHVGDLLLWITLENVNIRSSEEVSEPRVLSIKLLDFLFKTLQTVLSIDKLELRLDPAFL